MKRNISIMLALSLSTLLLTSCNPKEGTSSNTTTSSDDDTQLISSIVTSNEEVSSQEINGSRLNSDTMSSEEIASIISKGSSQTTVSKNPDIAIKIVKPEDFGAKADGKTNCAKAFSQAISECRNAEGWSVLQLSTGTYLIDKEIADGKNYSVDYGIFMHQMSDFTLQGSKTGKSTLLIANPSLGGLSIEGGVNVAIKNVTLDYKIVPYVQGTVVSADANAGKIVLDLDTGGEYPTLSDNLFRADVMTGTYGLPAHAKSDKTKSVFGPEAIMVDSNKPWQKISGNRWQINVEPASRNLITTAALAPGSRFIQGCHRWVYGMKFFNNKNVAVENVTIYTSPASVSTWGMNENITINGLRAEVKPGSTRNISTLADGIHGFGNRGKILVENCYFYGMGDDGINFHSRAGFVTSILSSTKVKVNPSGTNDYRVGDEIHIMDTVKKTIRAVVKLVAVEKESTYSHILTFDKAVSGMVVSEEDNNKTDTIYNASSCEQNAVIQNNTFNSNRGRHIVLRSHGVTIKNNTFNIGHGTWNAILLEFAQDWGEGPAPYNINILNNVFNDCGDTRGNIAIQTYTGNNIIGSVGRTIHNINIEGNKFNNMTYVVMALDGVNGVTLKNNEINVAAVKRASSLITARNCNGIKIVGLTGKDASPKSMTSALITLQNSVASGTSGYSASGINFNFTNSNKPLLLDDQR